MIFIFLGSVGVLFLAFADPLIRLFTTDPAAAITIAFSTLAVVSSLLFRRGKWKEKDDLDRSRTGSRQESKGLESELEPPNLREEAH